MTIDRFAAESIQFARELPEEAREAGLELGHALGHAIDAIPDLEAISAKLKGAEGEALKRHLSTLYVFRRFVEQAKNIADSMPTA